MNFKCNSHLSVPVTHGWCKGSHHRRHEGPRPRWCGQSPQRRRCVRGSRAGRGSHQALDVLRRHRWAFLLAGCCREKLGKTTGNPLKKKKHLEKKTLCFTATWNNQRVNSNGYPHSVYLEDNPTNRSWLVIMVSTFQPLSTWPSSNRGKNGPTISCCNSQ